MNKILISESVIKENVQYIPFDIEGENEAFEDMDMDEYEAMEVADAIAKKSGISILSDKELNGLLLDNNEIIGALWISNDNEEFSFDIAISPKYRNKGYSHILIKNALFTYDELNDMYYDINGEDMPMRIDVVNPILATTLQKKYGFKIIEKIGTNRVIMSK